MEVAELGGGAAPQKFRGIQGIQGIKERLDAEGQQVLAHYRTESLVEPYLLKLCGGIYGIIGEMN